MYLTNASQQLDGALDETFKKNTDSEGQGKLSWCSLSQVRISH